MKYMHDKTKAWKLRTGLGFRTLRNAGGILCYRFARIDQQKYGVIENVTDKGYYTNSYHVDVREKINAFDKFRFESETQNLSTGGAILMLKFRT